MNKLISKGIPILLGVIVILLFLYLSSLNFRLLLLYLNIDPNYLIVLLTSIALLISLLQASKDRKIGYNTIAVQSLEEKGVKVIGKLLTIKYKSEVLSKSLEYLNEAIKSKQEFKDLNNLLDKADIDNDLELISAYVDVYFPEISESWNSTWDNLSKIGNNFTSTYVNYLANAEEILKNDEVKIKEIDNLLEKLEESISINLEINKATERMRNKIIETLSMHKKILKSNVLEV